MPNSAHPRLQSLFRLSEGEAISHQHLLAEEVGATSAPSGRRRRGKGKGGKGNGSGTGEGGGKGGGGGGGGGGGSGDGGGGGGGGMGGGGGGTGARGAGGTGAVCPGAGAFGAAGARGTGAVGTGARGAGGTGARGAGGAGGTRAGGSGTVGLTPSLLCPPPDPSQTQLPPDSLLPAPSPYTKQTDSLTEQHELASCPASPICTARCARRVPRPRPPPVPGTHTMALQSDLARDASPNITRFLATLVTDPSFESTAASALVTELVDFAATCHLDYVATLVTESESDCPPSVGGELALGTDVLEDRFAPSTANPALFLRTDSSLPLFYICVYVDDLVFATADTLVLALVKLELQNRNTCTDLGPSALRLPVLLATVHSSAYRPLALSSTFGRVHLAYPLSILARYVAPRRHRPEHWQAATRVLRYLCSISGMGLVLGGRVFRRSTHSSSVLSLICEAEIYAGAMAAQELRWLTYLLTDLGERPHSLPVLYVNNEAMIALCQEQRLEHKRKHIAPR
ncbi:unnamed protein product [Closterium sp. NIES-53]